MTMVKKGAVIRAAGDGIFIEHEYPIIGEYQPIGRVLSYYTQDDALLVEFEIYKPNIAELISSGEKGALSVSWFSDNYEVKSASFGSYIEFNEIIIYEVSLCLQSRFNTCIATIQGELTCLSALYAI